MHNKARPVPSCGVCQSGRPAGCLSVFYTFVYDIKTSKHVMKYRQLATPFLFFLIKPCINTLTETSPTEAWNAACRCMGCEKSAIFDQHLAFSEMIHDRAIITMERQQELVCVQWPSVTFNLDFMVWSRYYLTSNISKTVQVRHAVTVDYKWYDLLNCAWIDFEGSFDCFCLKMSVWRSPGDALSMTVSHLWRSF